jgi:localization factor PodJL
LRALSDRLDRMPVNSDSAPALAHLEQRIAALTSTLESRERPVVNDNSEQIEGALRALSDRLDRMPVGSDSAPAFAHLEQRIAALSSTLESRERPVINDNSEQIGGALRALSDRLDRMPVGSDSAPALAHLEARIAALTSTLESRERPVVNHNSEQIEGALRALSERLDRISVGSDSASAFAHLEQRVSYLLERLEASTDQRGGNLGRVEQGLQDVLRQLESQHASVAALSESSRRPAEPAPDSGLIDVVKRELSDIRFSQSEAGRHTQDSLEAVHSTLGHVVDRLAMIEGDLRAVRIQPVAAPLPAPPAPQPAPPQPAAPRAELPPQPKPELPNPAAAQSHFAAAPREFSAATPQLPAVAAMAPKAITEILEQHAAQPRAAIVPELPPDHPLEPGTRPSGRVLSPSERIAASENAISEISASTREQTSTSNFIAAARRAAQAAAAAPPPDKAGRGPLKKGSAGDKAKPSSTVSSKIRSVLVGVSVVIIVLGTFKMAMTLLDGGSVVAIPALENSGEPTHSLQLPADDAAKPAAPAPVIPSLTSPTPIGRQSFNSPAPSLSEYTASAAIPPAKAMPSASPVSSGDITGTIPAAPTAPMARKLTMVQVPPTERLPDAIGGPLLRAAALKGDPGAAYEVGLRYAEGKGIAPNYDEAAKWYDRAAQAGVVPAVFRLGTLYEKGLSVTKDADIARRYYTQAAERGNAKAMHNLAVLEADGGGKGANYKNASLWFRKAADRGVADSQFNLGILYARGIGVEQNLAESFKWFSLAAAQGDADALRKRDDVAKRLDAQSLSAAKLAIQTFTVEPQPDDAVNAAGPAGGWDSAPVQAGAAKPGAKPVLTKRASAH